MTTTINASTSAGLVQTADTSGSLALQTANTTAVTIDSSQRVGIGVTSPAKPLSVYGADGYIQMLNASTGTANGDGAFIGVEGGTTALRIVNQENDAMSFHTNGLANERMRIESSGKVGIGTTSPTGILNVKGTGGDALPATSGSTQSAGLITRLQQGGGIGSVMDIGGNGGTGSWIQVTEASNLATNYNLLLNPNGGNLLVGLTANSYNSKLTVQSDASAVTPFSINDTSTGSTSRFIATWYRGGSSVGNISITNTTTAYNTSSDYRLKENIAPMTGALAKVAQLKPVTYKWKVDGSDGEGFIAHELAEVCPDAVVGTKDELDADGNPKYQGIDTSFLVATLTAAIQELKAINDQQAETINALTARVVALESK